MDYRKLLVKIMKEVVENNYMVVRIDNDGNITGDTIEGFITDDAIHIPISGLEEEYRKKNNIPEEIPYQTLPLGYINDIAIIFDKSVYNEREMEIITDDMYEILGEKFDLMTIEPHPQ